MRKSNPVMSKKSQGIVAGAAALVGFGIWYAHQVNEAETSGEIEGQSSLWVAFGTGVTVFVRHFALPKGKTKAEGLMWTLLAFFCSGAPMMLNQLDTHSRHQAAYRRRQRREKLCLENQSDSWDGLTTWPNGRATGTPKQRGI